MACPVGDAKPGPLRVDFDRRPKVEFHGSKITSDAGPLAYRELDRALGLTGMAGSILTEARRGKNIRRLVEGLFRQSVFGRLAGYEDRNDAELPSFDTATRRSGVTMQASAPRPGPGTRSGGSWPRSNGIRTSYTHGSASIRFAAQASPTGYARASESSPSTISAFYHQRGTAEPHIKEGKNAISWTRLSGHGFRNNEVCLQLHVLAYNMGNFPRTLALPDEIEHRSMTTLREKPIQIGAKVVRHGRYVTFQLAEIAIPRRLCAEILRPIDGLRPKLAPT